MEKMDELNNECGEIIAVVYGRADLETGEVEDEVWEVWKDEILSRDILAIAAFLCDAAFLCYIVSKYLSGSEDWITWMYALIVIAEIQLFFLISDKD